MKAKTLQEKEDTLRPLRVLLVEDSTDDALLLIRALKRGGYAPVFDRVDTAASTDAALNGREWDIVISDYHMPGFGALMALEMVKQRDRDLPFIIVSGNIGEDVAVAAMRAGAQDYVLKDNLARLVPAVQREVEDADHRRRRRAAEDELRLSRDRLNQVLGALGDVVWSVSIPGLRMEYLNPAVEQVYGRSTDEFIGDIGRWLEAVHPDDRETMGRYVDDVLALGTNSAEFRIVRPDGQVRWLFDRARAVTDANGNHVRIDGVTTDVTEHKSHQAELFAVAYHDALTGLPNRALMFDRLQQVISQHARTGQSFALVFIDLDRFKTINDSLGPIVGDEVLKELAARLSRSLRAEDTLARVGGDEFVLLLSRRTNHRAVTTVIQKLIKAIAPPVQAGDRSIHCTASFGIALYPSDGHDAEALLKNADAAMYQAKRAGRNTFRFYAAEMNAAAVKQLQLENDLREALERCELEVHYQPQFDLDKGGVICGFEALVRWRHPDRGTVPPAEFIPLAEETGLIVPIGEWVLLQACRQGKSWIDQYNRHLRVAVNLSARQFARPDLPQAIESVLHVTGLPARNLELELTESLVMHDPDLSARTLSALKGMGITIAVDDFGTGYSSLAYLKRFPIDVVKIDKSFVSGVPRASDDASICASIIAMAHSLRLDVVAEGIETESQLGFLVQQRCNRAQGFLFSPPLESSAAEKFAHGGSIPAVMPADDSDSKKLLLVDDEENILAALKRLFRRDGYQVLTASDPEQAFELLASNRIGVIVSDQRMPNLTGTEFLSRVKELYPDTVRIVLSGYTDLSAVIEAINEGSIYRFLTKPWDDDQLRAAIREAFRQQALAQENARLNRENSEASARFAKMNQQLKEILEAKSSRIARDEMLISATQEAFFHVPVPLMVVDDWGMVVLSNSRALELLPQAVPGCEVTDALPAAFGTRLTEQDTDTHPVIPFGNAAYICHRQRINGRSAGAGWLFAFLLVDDGKMSGPAGDFVGLQPMNLQ